MAGPLSWDEVAAVAIHAGWPPGPAVIAVSITEPESARIPSAVQQGQPYATTGWGLWQITPGDSVPQYGINQAMLDPLNNARAALAKYHGAGGFSPWTTWSGGLNVPYIPDATAAVQFVTGLSKKKLARLVAQARKGEPSGAAGGGILDWSPYVRTYTGHQARSAVHLAAAAEAIGHLHSRFSAPTVSLPDPGQLLWQPPRRGPHGRSEPQVARTGREDPAGNDDQRDGQRPGDQLGGPLPD
jgi:hypothetical protein